MNSAPEDTAARLLDYYHCTFFLPLIGLEQEHFTPNPALRKQYRVDDQSDPFEAQAWHYFTPAFRDILFDLESSEAASSIQEWCLQDIGGWELHLGQQADRNDPRKYQIASITSVRLVRYFNGLYLLAFRVEPKALRHLRHQQESLKIKFEAELRAKAKHNQRNGTQEEIRRKVNQKLDEEGIALFRPCPPETFLAARSTAPQFSEDYHQLELESWLRFTRLARLIYPSYPEQEQENKIALLRLFENPEQAASQTAFEPQCPAQILSQPGKDISVILRALLAKFATTTEKLDPFLDDYKNLYDDRLFVSVAYGIAGQALNPQSFEKVFHLALWVDRHEDILLDGYAYTPSEIKHRSADKTYRLWEGLGGRYGFTGFSNVYLYRGSFFRDPIAPNHIIQIYDRMLIQALFYQATLRDFDQKISHQTHEIFNPDKQGRITAAELNRVRLQRRGFIQFTNCWWHHQLTEQMQGREIFNHQQQALALTAQYEVIKDELERTDEHLQMEDENRMAHLSELIGRWGVFIALVATWYTALPAVSDYWKNSGGETLYSRFAGLLPVSFNDPEFAGFYWLVVGPVLPFLVFYLGYLIWDAFKIRKK